jgi:cell division protease FtsH
MVKRYGLSPKFRNLVFGDENEEIFVGQSFGQVQSYSDATAYEIDKEVQRIITACYEDTKRILRDKKDIVEGLAQRLIEKYKVDGPEFEAIYEAEGDLDLAAKILEEMNAQELKEQQEKEAKEKAEEASEEVSEEGEVNVPSEESNDEPREEN